jgi:hypothetical protein
VTAVPDDALGPVMAQLVALGALDVALLDVAASSAARCRAVAAVFVGSQGEAVAAALEQRADLLDGSREERGGGVGNRGMPPQMAGSPPDQHRDATLTA